MRYRLVFIFIILSCPVWAQSDTDAEMRSCATMEQDSINRVKYSNWGSLDELEIAIQQKISEINLRRANGRIQAEIISIPVIFHIVHNGESIGTGTNILSERIEAQIQVLNEDFRRAVGSNGYNDHPDGADIEIEFCLASVNDAGIEMIEPGINRINGGLEAWTRNQIEGELKPLTIWNPNLYYNIWSLDFTGEDELLLGYAQFPSSSNLTGLPESGGPSSTDGVVLRFDVVGSSEKGDFPGMREPYNKGRTLTHETGHWLGLRHIWGDGACSADDFCDDTPPASGPHRGCPIGVSSCSTIDMVENYMDYTDDACMNIFTKDQKARILAVMELSPRRGILVNSTVCGTVVEDPPIANLAADKTNVLLGGTVKFTDLSTNFPQNWEWNFEGGDPSVSTGRNPIVTYNSAGTYDVSLTSSNANGSSETVTLEDYISVSSEGLCNTLTNFGNGTATVLTVPILGDSIGYVAGHNSMGDLAKSEFFTNELGYLELGGAQIRFGYAFSEDEDAVAKIVVWNALGPQNAPARIVEEKEILIKQIKEDIAANRPTEIVFDRRVPIFLGTSFHIGLKLDYNGDSLAISTTADGESTTQTSWEQNSEEEWIPYSLSWGLNVAHDITALVGMKPSVQLASSQLSAFKGQEVVLNASGASIFNWTSDDGSVSNELGPQITVTPRQTTTYTVEGSGLSLCKDNASVTIYVKENPTGLSNEIDGLEINLFPNPVSDHLTLTMSGVKQGQVRLKLIDQIGKAVWKDVWSKNSNALHRRIQTSGISSGIYILLIEMDNEIQRKKVVIRN